MIARSRIVALAALAVSSTACGGTLGSPPPFPTGKAVALLDGPVHLGDNRAGSQSFPSGDARAARICSLINLPRATHAHLRVVGIRQTESLRDVVTVNGQSFPLPITLERDPNNLSPNATTTSQLYPVLLPDGPTEVCLVAGIRPCGDLDDFEVDQMELYPHDMALSDVAVRRNLTSGTPAPVQPPSESWGRQQHPYGVTLRFGGAEHCSVD